MSEATDHRTRLLYAAQHLSHRWTQSYVRDSLQLPRALRISQSCGVEAYVDPMVYDVVEPLGELDR